MDLCQLASIWASGGRAPFLPGLNQSALFQYLQTVSCLSAFFVPLKSLSERACQFASLFPLQLILVALIPVNLKGVYAADIGNVDWMFEGFILWVIDHVAC